MDRRGASKYIATWSVRCRAEIAAKRLLNALKKYIKFTFLEIIFCVEGCFGCGLVCIVGVNVGECGFGDVVRVAL